MELPVKFEKAACWQMLYNGVVSREELSESMLPDAMPDLARVLEVESQVFLEAKAASGRVSFSGRIRSEVLYQPEEGGIRSLPVVIPFQFGEEVSGMEEQSVIHAKVRAATGDVRILNPRKLLLRIGMLVELQVFGSDELACQGTLPQQEKWGLETRTVEELTEVICAVPRKPFAFEDRLVLPGGGQRAERILKCRPVCSVSEARVVGSKLMVKGKVTLLFLMNGEEGELFQSSFDLPFSQIMEACGASEKARVQAEVHLTDCNYELTDGGSTVDISFDLLAQAVLREERQLTLTADAYSVGYPVELETSPMSCIRMTDSGTLRQNVRELIECGMALQRVQDIRADLGLASQSTDGTTRTLMVDVAIHACVCEEGGRITSLSRTYPVSVQLEAPDEAEVRFDCEVTDLQGDPTGGGAEVRFSVHFSYAVYSRKTLEILEKLTVNEEQPRDCSGSPSLVLRRVQSGETLWELAKGFHTRGADILEANGLEGEDLEEGSFLLIPRRR